MTLTAQTYSGEPAGMLILPFSDSGYAIAPNGTKVLNRDQIIAASGTVLGSIPEQFFQPALPPTWADDSAHLCEVYAPIGSAAEGTLIEFDDTGQAHAPSPRLGPPPR